MTDKLERDDLDELLRKADALLGEEDQEPAQEDFQMPEPPAQTYYANFNNNYGRDYRKSAETPQAGGIPAYNPDFQEADPVMRPAREPRRASGKVAVPPQPHTAEKREKKKKRPKKKKHFLRTFLCIIILLLAIIIVPMFLLMKQPVTNRPIGERKKGASTILLCGTDEDGYRTDTMMLLYVNAKEKAVNLVSLPRDTMTLTPSGNYEKLNSAFGRNGGADDPEEGMEELMGYVKDIVGYRPDGYMLIDLNGFVELVDVMGGVEFDVPQDMFYEDPSQNLYIDLKAGHQKLNGQQAMGLVRYREGYFNQDLGRVEVQRAFISACMDQWLSVGSVAKLPRIISCLNRYTVTDLSTGNLIWLGVNAWKAGFGNIQTQTLPGYADYVDGLSYYILYPDEVADTVNTYCNPYKQEIYSDELDIAE